MLSVLFLVGTAALLAALPNANAQFNGYTTNPDNTWSTAAVFPPDVPTGLAGTSNQDSQVPLTWVAANRATGYEVRYRVNGAPSWVSPTVTTALTLTTVSGLVNGTTYEFQVRATNAGGNSAYTGSATATPAGLPVLTASGGTTAHTENVPVFVDTGITVADPDSANMASGTVTVGTGYTAGQDVLAFTNQNGITGSWSAPTLTLTGSASKANWQTALRSITYNNTSDAPNTGNRTINFVVSDGTYSSATASKTVSVAAVNDAPVLTASGGTTAHTENVAVAVDTGITVSDPDTTNIASGTVTVGTGYTAGQDVLAFTNQNGISGSWSAPTLTLTGSASQANWQTALASITYNNTSDAPNTGNRTINFVVNDGSTNSNTAAKTVSITAVNDAPVNSVPGAQSAFAGTAKVFSSGNSNLISISDADAASSSVQVQLVSSNGTTTLSGTTGLTFSVGDGTADATMTFTGTVTNVNTALAGLGFTATAAGAASLQIVTSDQGNTGTGGTLTDNDTISITATNAYGLFTTATNVGSGSPGGTSSAYNSGTSVYTEVGNGADINNNSDEFHYVYKSWTGDGTIIARLTSFTNTSIYAKAGVMFREDATAGSKYARMDVKPVGGDGSEWGYRSSTNGATTQAGQPNMAPTYWVKLVRSGNTFTGYNAPDSSGSPGSWTQRGTQSITMASTILVGLATCSHNTSSLATAVYDHVTVS